MPAQEVDPNTNPDTLCQSLGVRGRKYTTITITITGSC